MQQENKLQPNYYAIIPANIRYDKNLNSTEKLLYAELTALCDKEGYCWASNNYFAEILNKLPAYISQVLTKLSKKEYITIEIERNNKGTFRKIYIGKIIKKIYTEKESKTTENEKIFTETEKIHTENSIEGDIEITTEGVQKKLYGGIEKTIEGYRNNYIQKNNTINNTKEYKKEKILKENSEEKNSENFEEDFEENEIQEFETLENENLNNSKNELTTKSLKTEITPRPTKTEILQNDPNYQDFLEISNGIKQLIESQKRINITNSQLSNWITEISKLYKSLESARGSENAIYSMFLMINTLNADIHYEDKYKPVIESGKSFREKFIKIEDYYKRRQMQYIKQKKEDDWDDLVL